IMRAVFWFNGIWCDRPQKASASMLIFRYLNSRLTTNNGIAGLSSPKVRSALLQEWLLPSNCHWQNQNSCHAEWAGLRYVWL
ncbi:MAG: hypothetical protein IKD69_12650, partial [Solobacterium sp.]|nr:hypothetical protein [Solobacterium sp.]